MTGAWERMQPCWGLDGRTRQLKIFLTDTNLIGVHAPPGEVGLVDLQGAVLLEDHAAEAIREATRRAAGTSLTRDLQYQRMHDFVDYVNKRRQVGVAARDGWVTLYVPGWVKSTPDQAGKLADSLRAASAVARLQERGP